MYFYTAFDVPSLVIKIEDDDTNSKMISPLDTPSYVLDCKSVLYNDNDVAKYRVILIITYYEFQVEHRNIIH